MTRNWQLKVLSLVLSMLLWLVWHYGRSPEKQLQPPRHRPAAVVPLAPSDHPAMPAPLPGAEAPARTFSVPGPTVPPKTRKFSLSRPAAARKPVP